MSDHEVQQRITEFWNTVAPEYEAHPGNVPKRDGAEHRAWVDAIRDLLPSAPADVLDIATGTGFVAIIAARIGHRMTALDASVAMLDQARNNARAEGVDVSFASGDAVEPLLPRASFDAIICRHLLWTLREPERAFSNWLALLRPRGRVVAIDGFWFNSRDEVPGEEEPGLPAMHLRSVEPIVETFRSTGFTDVTTGELAQVHALADDPPSTEPWYFIVAARPG